MCWPGGFGNRHPLPPNKSPAHPVNLSLPLCPHAPAAHCSARRLSVERMDGEQGKSSLNSEVGEQQVLRASLLVSDDEADFMRKGLGPDSSFRFVLPSPWLPRGHSHGSISRTCTQSCCGPSPAPGAWGAESETPCAPPPRTSLRGPAGDCPVC